jgi:hypothetical protein
METLYEKASLILNPGVYDSGKVYATKPFDGSGDLTFTRASNATRVASNGLIEKVRTNVLLQSNSFNTWTASNATVTSGQAGYDGTNTAWLIKGDTTTSRHNVFRSNSLAGEQTLSIYAKAGGHSFLQIAMAMTVDQYANFDLSTGTIGNAGSDFFNAQITSVGNGWYRISALTLSPGNIYISLVSSNTAGWLESWAMPNNTDGVLIMNGQLEAGVLTEFIGNTTTAAVSVGPVSGLPRLDYLNSSCPRLLLEPQRTNVCLWSENFDNAGWNKQAGTVVTANQTISPDGTQNADLIVGTGNGILISDLIVPSASANTKSVYLKGVSGGEVVLLQDPNQTIGNTICNLTTSWQRFTLTETQTGGFGGLWIAGIPAGGIYAWGAQVEVGSYATSYIPTLSTSVTRVADAASKTGISSLIGQTEGTLFASFVDTETSRIIAIGDGNVSNRLFLLKNSNGTVTVFLGIGGSGIFFVGSTQTVISGLNKIAVRYKSGDTKVYLNGLSAISVANTFTISSMPNLYIGTNEFGASNEKVNIQEALVFKTALTNAQLAELTTL